MIKIKIIIVFLLLPVLAYTQLDSSSVIIRLNGGYADIDLSNGVASLGGVASNTSSWNVGFSLGLVVNKKWEVGLGFDYMKQKTTAESQISIPTMFLSYQETDTKVNIYMGKLYLSGYWRLFNRFYFNPIFSTNIGKAAGFQKYSEIVGHNNDISNPDPNHFSQDPILMDIFISERKRNNISFNYFSLSLSPAFSYYFTQHFGLNLETGCFQFSTVDWEWDNKRWLANINPEYWRLGIFVSF